MTWTYTDEYYKNYTRDTWNESAHAYDPIERNLNVFNPDLLKHAAPLAGQHVLDVACGAGEPSLSIAPLVGARGRVLGIDLSERMIERARERAKAARLPNAEFEVMDAEALTVPEGAFDLATCRFGLQIVTNPEKALAELYRVVKPGGGLAATVWGAGETTPAIHVIIGPMLEHAEPDETGYLPTPYEMGGPGELAKIFRDAGFRDTREERVVKAWTFRDEEHYLDSVLKGTPIGHSLSEEDADVQKDVLAKTRENLRAYRTAQGIVLPAECVVVSARR